LFGPLEVGIPIGGFTIVIVSEGQVIDITRWRAKSMAGTPAIGVGSADDDRWTVADGVITIQIGIVVAAALIIVIAIAGRIITPPRIPGAHKNR
jgi:hypothetical protein